MAGVTRPTLMETDTDDSMSADFGSGKPPVLDEISVDAVEVEDIAIDESKPPILTEEWGALADEEGSTMSDDDPKPAGRMGSLWRRLCSAADWVFGTVSLLVGLALLSVIPILNFASLGYLLQASANVARSGRLRDGFVGVRKASRLGSFVLGTWLVLLPLRQVAGM